MNKEEFMQKLDQNLRYLKKKEKKEELAKYNSLNSINLDPIIEANKIYEARGLKIRINEELKLFDAISILIDNFKLKNRKKITDLLLFFLYLLLLIILIKMPFIYTRDMISNLFNNLFTTNLSVILWNIFFEIIYAITSIIFIIKQIKKKAIELKKNA